VYESWQGIYFFTKSSRPVLGPTNHPFEWVVRGLCGSEAAHPPPSSIEDKNQHSCTSALLAWPHGMDRNNLTFYSVGVSEK